MMTSKEYLESFSKVIFHSRQYIVGNSGDFFTDGLLESFKGSRTMFKNFVLQGMFCSHLISLREDVSWTPCFPGLSPCDVFLWGYFKVFKHRPRTLRRHKEGHLWKNFWNSTRYANESDGKLSRTHM